MLRIISIILCVSMPVYASGQDKLVILNGPESLSDSGFWSYVLPRFKLKTGIKVISGAIEDADIVVLLDEDALTSRDRHRLMVHGKSNQGFSVEQVANDQHTTRFSEWLLSEIGQRTISGYQEGEEQIFYPAAPDDVKSEIVIMTGDTELGEEVSLRKCGRCHMISEKNKFGGIGSTPSFPALRTLKDWREKFAVFWTLNPHPSFTQIDGITEDFDPAYPPHIYPIYLTITEVENIGAFMETIEPADLGPPIQMN